MKLIRMVWINGDCYLFLYGVTKDDELVFRVSHNIKRLQTEKVFVDKGVCYTNLYHFSMEFLKELPLL